MSKTKQELIAENEVLYNSNFEKLKNLSEYLINLQLTNNPGDDKYITDAINSIENTLLYFLQLNTLKYRDVIYSIDRPAPFIEIFEQYTGYDVSNRIEFENKSSLLSLFNSYLEYEKLINESEYISKKEIEILEFSIDEIKKHFVHIYNEHLDADYLPHDLKQLYDSYIKLGMDENWDGKEFLKHNFFRIQDNNKRWEEVFNQISDNYNKARDLSDKIHKGIDLDINEIERLDLLIDKINKNFEKIRNSRLKEEDLNILLSGDVNDLYRDYLEYVKSDEGPITEFLKKKIELAEHNKTGLAKITQNLEFDFEILENFYEEKDKLPTKNEYDFIFDTVQRINKNFKIIKNSNLYKVNYKEKLSDRVNYKYNQYLEHKENRKDFLEKDIIFAIDRQKKCLDMFKQLNSDFSTCKDLTRKVQNEEKLTKEEINQLDSAVDRINKNCERIRSSGLKIDQLPDGLSDEVKFLYEDYEKHSSNQKANIGWVEYFYSYIKTPEVTKDRRFLNDFVEKSRNTTNTNKIENVVDAEKAKSNNKMLTPTDLVNIKYALSEDLKNIDQLKLELQNNITNPFESEKHVKSLNILVKRLNENLKIFKTQVSEKDQLEALKEIPKLESIYVDHENSENYLGGNNPTILSFISEKLMNEYRRNNPVSKDSENITKIVQNLNANMNRLSDLKSRKTETEPGSEYDNLGKIVLKDLALLSNIMIADQGRSISYLDYIKEGRDRRVSNLELIKQAQNYQKNNVNIEAGSIAEKTENTLRRVVKGDNHPIEKQDTNQQKEQTMSKNKLNIEKLKQLNIRNKLKELDIGITKEELEQLSKKELFGATIRKMNTYLEVFETKLHEKIKNKQNISDKELEKIKSKLVKIKEIFPAEYEKQFIVYANPELQMIEERSKLLRDNSKAVIEKFSERMVKENKGRERKYTREEALRINLEKANIYPILDKALSTLADKKIDEKTIESNLKTIKSILDKVTINSSEEQAIHNVRYIISEMEGKNVIKFLPEILDAIDIKNLSKNARKTLADVYPADSAIHSLIKSDYLKREITDQAANLSKVIKQSPEKYVNPKETIRSFKDGRENAIKAELTRLIEFYKKVKPDSRLNVTQAASEEIKSILDYASTKGDIDVVKMIIENTPKDLLTNKTRVSAINSALNTGKHDVALCAARVFGEQDLIKHKDASMDTRKLCVIYGAEVKDLKTQQGLLPAEIKELKAFKFECDRTGKHAYREQKLEALKVINLVVKGKNADEISKELGDKSALGKAGVKIIVEIVKANSDKIKTQPQSFIGKIFDAVVSFCKDVRDNAVYRDDKDKIAIRAAEKGIDKDLLDEATKAIGKSKHHLGSSDISDARYVKLQEDAKKKLHETEKKSKGDKKSK